MDAAPQSRSVDPADDAWMQSWWYHPVFRWVTGALSIGVVLAVTAQSAVFEGEYELLIFLLLGFGVVVPLERLMPRHEMPVFRPHWLTDLMHVLCTGFLSFAPLIVIFPLLEPLRLHAAAEFIAEQPVWLQIGMAFFLREFLIYWAHRITHMVPLLWRFHAVHHSVRDLDWLGGERRHPVDGVFVALFVGVPMLVTGFDLVDLLLLGLINELWDMTIHANFRWRLRWLDGIWVTTEFHHWHHSLDREARDRNFSGALPVFDRLFGTWYLPDDRHPGPYGIDEHMPGTYVGQLLQPFRRRVGSSQGANAST